MISQQTQTLQSSDLIQTICLLHVMKWDNNSHNKKRGRDDVDGEYEIQFLEVIQDLHRGNGLDVKLRALDALDKALIDDDLYICKRKFIELDGAFLLKELIGDPSPAVRIKAANAVASLTAHSEPTLKRLSLSHANIDNTFTRLLLNPCASAFIETDIASALLPMLFSQDLAFQEAALDAMHSICSYNRQGQLSFLEALVTTATQGQELGALKYIDALLEGMECRSDDVADLLEALCPAISTALPLPPGCAPVAALSLLATICHKSPECIPTLMHHRCLPLIADLLTHPASDIECQDASVYALYRLVRGGGLSLTEEGLERPLVELKAPLIRLITLAAEEEEAREKDDDDVVFDICFAQYALELLNDIEKETECQQASSCTVM